MHTILSATPAEPVDGHVDLDFADRSGWVDAMGAMVLAILIGDERSGPFLVLSYVEPTDEQMPLSFAHGHPSDNWRISVRGTTNMGRDTYEQGQFRFHDGGVPYASDNFAWGPDGGYGVIMFADRRGFPIRPVSEELAAKVGPEQDAQAELLGIEIADPCPGAPAIATTMGPTARGHLDGGFDSSSTWAEIGPGLRMAAGIAGEPTSGPVLVLLDAAPGTEVVPARTVRTEVIVLPVDGSLDAGAATLRQGDVRVDVAGTEQPALVAGADGAQVVVVVGDRRGLRASLEDGSLPGALGASLASTLDDLEAQLTPGTSG